MLMKILEKSNHKFVIENLTIYLSPKTIPPKKAFLFQL